MARILLVEDEVNTRQLLSFNLRQDQHEIREVRGVGEAGRALASQDFDAVFAGQRIADGDGLAVLAAAHEADPSLSVIFLMAGGTLELAIQGIDQGAFDFLVTPLVPAGVRAAARRACERTCLLRENGRLRDAAGRLAGPPELYGVSSAMAEIRTRIARVAPTSATVWITGETGTGKQLVARALHCNSPRAGKPFLALNCAAFPETLLERELFGHERGAFTGADRCRQGLFELAHEGTLFLEQAGEMSPAAQAKLLSVLTDGHVVRAGSTRPRAIDVRVLVATRCDLEQLAKDGSFRADLFHRLAVLSIALPPLRERREDIPGLCDLFSRQIATEMHLPRRPISPLAIENLKRYEFPGNLRELRNLIERAHILSSTPEIGPDAFPLPRGAQAPIGAARQDHPLFEDRALPDSFDLSSFLEQTERELIVRALAAAKGAQAEAARRMGVSRSLLSYKLSKYGIRPTDSP
jgi:DNA-binding NtrC family response regulator